MHQCTYILFLIVSLVFRNAMCLHYFFLSQSIQTQTFLLILAAAMRISWAVNSLPFFFFFFFLFFLSWKNEVKPLRAEIYLLHASLPFSLEQLRIFLLLRYVQK